MIKKFGKPLLMIANKAPGNALQSQRLPKYYIDNQLVVILNLIPMRTNFKKDLRLVKEVEPEKISVSECRKILGNEGQELNDEEVLEVRDFFYRLAAIVMEQYRFEKAHKTPVIKLEHSKISQYEEESDYLRAS